MTAASLAGTALTGAAGMKQGQQSRAIGEFNAKELERGASEDRAAAARKAYERRQLDARVRSEQRAKAASGGAGTSQGEGYLDLMSDTAQRGEYLAELEIGLGEERARGREGQAAAVRWQGEGAERTGYVKAAKSGLDAIQIGLNDDDLLGYAGGGQRSRRGRYYN